MLGKYRNYLRYGRALIENEAYRRAQRLSSEEYAKQPNRTEVINFLIEVLGRPVNYLEIGVRNPQHNFVHIKAHRKWSVDPGVEYAGYRADFPMTSDAFFSQWNSFQPALPVMDIIFIDGLHLAPQAERDIEHALQHIATDGFVVVHDCNPPTEWHAREDYGYHLTPAGGNWDGTTWKAFVHCRTHPHRFSCCVDADWGIGVFSLERRIGNTLDRAPGYYEYADLDTNRKALLNLVSFDDLKRTLLSVS